VLWLFIFTTLSLSLHVYERISINPSIYTPHLPPLSLNQIPPSFYPTIKMNLNRLSLQSFVSTHTLDRESSYLSTTTLLRRIRLGLSLLIFAVSVAIIACESDALRHYYASHLSSQWWLPLYPNHFDLRPTKALLTCASIVAGITLIYIGASVIPSVSIPGSIHSISCQANKCPATLPPHPPPCFLHSFHHPFLGVNNHGFGICIPSVPRPYLPQTRYLRILDL
jgi:hypothetical protein